MVPWNRRRMSWRSRYILGGSIPLLSALGCWALVAERSFIEPAIRIVHTVFLARRAGVYEPADYAFYIAFLAISAFASFVGWLWSLATHRATDRKVDLFLAARLPKHEVTLRPERDD